jgi:hypothetical protein
MEARIRSRRGFTNQPRTIEVKNFSCAPGASQWTYESTNQPIWNEGENETMVDYVTPEFHKRRAKGDVIFNNMSYEKLTGSAAGSNYHLKYNTPVTPCGAIPERRMPEGHCSQRCVPNTVIDGIRYPTEATAVSQSDVDRMIVGVSTEVLSKRGRSDSDLWESMAEYKQTLELLQNPLNRLRSLSQKLLQSANGSSRVLLKEVSGGYLLHRYGIIPLMKDIESILKSLSRVTGKQRKTVRASDSRFAVAGANGTFLLDVIEGTWKRETRENVIVRAMSLDEVDLSFGSNIGFSVKGLVTLPWELTGYSFVADWFLNVGDYLGAHAPAPGYKQLGSCVVVQRVTSNMYTYMSTGISLAGQSINAQLASPLTGTVAMTRVSKTRGPLAYPGVVIKSDFKFDSFTRAGDAFALLAQRFIKIKTLVGPQPNLSAFKQKSAYKKWLNQPDVVG